MKTMKKFLLRIDAEVYKEIVRLAKENDRSVNGEIINRLKKSI
jgi:hypothetical protein|tara:strand:- start:1118 stop:1246 length:129 start_codon:yes stop_codon:yes gene_type:complete